MQSSCCSIWPRPPEGNSGIFIMGKYELQVLEERHEGEVYARKLTLSAGDPADGGRIVMTGMMRMIWPMMMAFWV